MRFVGQGVILPDAKTLTVPFEAVSARAVRVTALQVFETNIPQFLQVNTLVGHAASWAAWAACCGARPFRSPRRCKGRWTRYNLDVTELTRQTSRARCSS